MVCYVRRTTDSPAYEYSNAQLRSEFEKGQLAGMQVRHSNSTTWISVEEYFGETPCSSSTSDSSHPEVARNKFVKRYRDAYLVATATIAISDIIKIVAACIGLFAALGAIVAASASNSGIVFGAGLLGAVIAAVPLFVLGVLLAAAGQVLRSSLDAAVYACPFMDESEKLQAIS